MRCRSETGNGRKSDCGNSRNSGNNTDTVDDSDQQDDNKNVEEEAQDVGGLHRV